MTMDQTEALSEMITCLVINPSGFMKKYKTGKTLSEYPLDMEIEDKLKLILRCQNYRKYIAKVKTTSESYYHAFYESAVPIAGKNYNQVGTHLINHIYDDDNIKSDSSCSKCYGNCYLVHYDIYQDVYSPSGMTFVNSYNLFYADGKAMDRNKRNKIYKEIWEDICRLYPDRNKKPASRKLKSNKSLTQIDYHRRRSRCTKCLLM